MTTTDSWSDLKWDAENCQNSLSKIYQDTLAFVEKDRDWYTRNAKIKRQFAQIGRVTALVFLGLGSIIPLLIDIFNWQFPPSIATLFLALGAGILAFDRHMGHSSGWMRFLNTEMLIKSRLDTFRYEWEAERSAWPNSVPTAEQIKMMVNRCASFRGEISGIVREETQAWTQEYQTSLVLLDEQYKRQAESIKVGAVNMTVENCDGYAGGWEVLVDDRPAGRYFGNTGAVNNLLPGIRTFTIIARDDNHQLTRLSKAVNVTAGQLTAETFVLPVYEENSDDTDEQERLRLLQLEQQRTQRN